MGTTAAANLSITGIGEASGGTYRHVSITGEGMINGDLYCEKFACTGKSIVNGSAKVDTLMWITGTSQISNNLNTAQLKINGQLDCEQTVTSKDIFCRGSIHVKEDLHGDKVRILGELTTEGDCGAEIFHVKGRFSISGLLNAGEMNIKLYGECYAGEIGGESIRIRKSNALLRLFQFLKKPQLETESIEGDHIWLENTKAGIVRGKQVTIGPGCEIDLVEYKEQLHIDHKSIVRVNKQV